MESPEIARSGVNTAVFVWTWKDAPEEFKKLSRSGGDEDYVAFVPDGVDPFYKLYEMSCCDNEVHRQLDGSEIVIGSHA